MRPLLLSALLAATPVAALACPNWQGTPTYGDVQLSAGFLPDPHTVSLVAGGPNDLTKCGVGGAGFVATDPDYDVYWSDATGSLTFSVTSAQDTVLLINAPDGSWLYNDDTNGLNPVIVVNKPQEGLYDVWVGSYDPTGYADAQLSVSEF